MIILKGDIVRTSSGVVGEVLEVWGVARSFIRLDQKKYGMYIITFESDVVEIIQRPIRKRSPRERR